MKLFPLMLLFCLTVSLQAQQYLYIQKDHDIPQKRFALKEEVTFRMGEEEEWVEGRLDGITEKSIIVDDVTYPLDRITAFRSHHNLLHFAGGAMVTAGAFFTAIIFVNRLVNGDKPLLRAGQIIFGAGMVGGGYLVRWLSRKTYEKEEGWQWKVIDLNQQLKANGE